MRKKTYSTIVSQTTGETKHSDPQDKRGITRLSEQDYRQLSLFVEQPTQALLTRKPQISSIPGISLKQRNRYQVKAGNEILGMHLTIDEAIALAKGGKR